MDQQGRAKLVDSFDELFTATLLVCIGKQTPLGARFVKSEVNKLSGKFGLLYFYFRGSGCETKGAASIIGFLNTRGRSEEHTSELQSPCNLVCRLLLEK